MAAHLTRTLLIGTVRKVVSKSGYLNQYSSVAKHIKKDVGGDNGISIFFRRQRTGYRCFNFQSAVIFQMHGVHTTIPCFSRSITSTMSETRTQKKTPQRQEKAEPRNDVTAQDPFDDSPTYNIPEKPVSFVEGASYSVVILAGLGVALLAGYAVIKELILQPNEYKVFGKALARVQDDAQVRVRIGSPVKGYGQETWNRGARQQIPSRMWTDEDGIEHVEVQFLIRGPHGGGKVFAEMFKDKVEKQWKYTYLIVEIASPSPSQLMLESYVPA